MFGRRFYSIYCCYHCSVLLFGACSVKMCHKNRTVFQANVSCGQPGLTDFPLPGIRLGWDSPADSLQWTVLLLSVLIGVGLPVCKLG